jgi:putative DNA primase/helicase
MCARHPKRTDAALAIWQPSLVETYLASRGLHVPPPPTLRFHAGLKHPSGGIWPAMVGLVTCGSDGTPLAIHRTILTRNQQF